MRKIMRIGVGFRLVVSLMGCALISGCITPKPTGNELRAPGLINLDTTSGYKPQIGDWYRFEVRWVLTGHDPLLYCRETLDSIAAFLRFHPNVICEIGVHTDFRASMEYNDTLTFKRAKTIADYIVMKGTDPIRIIPVGYGERVPRVLDRDIFVPEWKTTVPKGAHLTEEYINGLKTNYEKEAAHQLNRRVELVIFGFVQNGKNQFFYN